MSYATLLLDLDHTLFDSDASEHAAFNHTLEAVGVADPDSYRELYRRINLKLWARVERHELPVQMVRHMRFEQLVEAAQLDCDPHAMAENFVQELGANGELYDGALQILQHLAERAPLALVTNGLGEVQRARLERLGIGDLFDAVVISAEVNVAKPSVAIFDIAFEALGGPARESALMVGDSLSSDMQGGANYGIATCWYNPRGHAADDTDLVVHEIRELAELADLVV